MDEPPIPIDYKTPPEKDAEWPTLLLRILFYIVFIVILIYVLLAGFMRGRSH